MSSPNRFSRLEDEYMRPDRPDQRRRALHTTKTDASVPFEICGKFIMRCVHPFISVNRLMDVAHEVIIPGSIDINEKVREQYRDYWAAAMSFSPALRMRARQGDPKMSDVKKGIAKGSRASRSYDIHRLKINTAWLISESGAHIALCSVSKSDRGFNHDLLGRMLLPIQHIGDYDKDPVNVRAKVNAGSKEYQVTAEYAPSFLYEDPLKYDPDNVASGFMRGYFLARCLRAIFLGRRAAMRGLGPDHKPSRACVAELCGVVSVTVPIMVYVAVLARFTLSSQHSWTGRDGMFNYEEFAELLFQVFKEDEKWTGETIRWWNKELFGNENGRRIARLARRNSPNGFLAKVKAQTAKRRAEQTAAKRQVKLEDPFPWKREGTPISALLDEVENHADPPSSHRSPRPTGSGTPPSPGASRDNGEGTVDEDEEMTTSVRYGQKLGQKRAHQTDPEDDLGESREIPEDDKTTLKRRKNTNTKVTSIYRGR